MRGPCNAEQRRAPLDLRRDLRVVLVAPAPLRAGTPEVPCPCELTVSAATSVSRYVGNQTSACFRGALVDAQTASNDLARRRRAPLQACQREAPGASLEALHHSASCVGPAIRSPVAETSPRRPSPRHRRRAVSEHGRVRPGQHARVALGTEIGPSARSRRPTPRSTRSTRHAAGPPRARQTLRRATVRRFRRALHLGAAQLGAVGGNIASDLGPRVRDPQADISEMLLRR
jgi:hypothetical protein